MPTSILTFDLHEAEVQQVQVWVQNPTFAALGSWVTVPRLRCDTLRNTLPVSGISSAKLSYDYGRIDSGAGWEDVLPLGTAGSAIPNLMRSFIRVVVYDPSTGLPDARWVGCVTLVEDSEFKQPAPFATGDTVQSYGTQTLTASGPEWLLNRKQIVTSVTSLRPGIPRGLPFNISVGRIGLDGIQFGNKATSAAVFHETDFGEPASWTGEDIVNYLRTYYFPTTLDTESIAPFVSPIVAWSMQNEGVLSSVIPVLEAHGKTIYELLNELASPQRFLSWTLKYVPGGTDAQFGSWNLIFNSASSLVINLPSGKTVAANPRVLALNLSGTVGGRVSLTGDAQQEFAQVIVTGARKGIVATVPVGQDLLASWWSTDEEDKYKDGAKVTMTPAAWEELDQTVQESLNATLRNEVYGHVYTRFASDSVWNVLPGLTATHFDTSTTYSPALRWQRRLPLKQQWDYTGVIPQAKLGASTHPEFVDAFAIYRFTDDNSKEWFAKHDNISAMLQLVPSRPGGVSNVSTRPLEDAFGIELTPSSKPPHWQAKTSSVDDLDDDTERIFSYETDIQYTGYFQVDEYAKGVWPVMANTTNNASTLLIRLGDVAFYDLLDKGTIVDIDVTGGDTKLVKATNDVLVRDDTEILEDIARLAYEWYGVRRYAYAISYAQIVRDVEPGMVVSQVDGGATDVIITEVAWDFNARQTNIATSYAAPDFSVLAKEAIVTRVTR